MTTIVHHYYPHGSRNIGDELVAVALRQSLTRLLGEVRFFSFPANSTYRGPGPIGLCGENLARNNREADLVLIGGSNLLEPRKAGTGQPGKRGQTWGVVTSVESIDALERPVWLIGQGTGSSYGQPILPFRGIVRDEVSRLFQKADLTTVRDVSTAEQLCNIGVSVPCTGCPVTYLTDRPVTAGSSSDPLLVSFPPERITRTWSGRRFMRQTMEYVEWLRQKGVEVLVTLHDHRDREPAREWVPAGVEIFDPSTIRELVDRFERCRGVIGFRLHAALLGLGLGKPILPVGIDWRGLGFIKTFELEDLSISPEKWGQFAKLRQLTERLLDADSNILDRLSDQKQAFREKHQALLRHGAERLMTSNRRRAA